MKRAVAVLLLAFLGPAGAIAASPQVIASQEIASIEKVTQQIRQLHQRYPVKTKLLSDSAFNSVVNAFTRAQNPASEVDLSDRELVLLGLLNKNVNFSHLVYSGLSKLAVGMYDYLGKTLYIRNHAGAALGPERYVIAHEYNHALQDQNFNLEKLLPTDNGVAYRNSDAIEAHHALAEGDSVNLETLFIEQTYSTQDLSALTKLESQPSKSPVLPPAIKLEFFFPYTSGLAFVQTLYQRGGMSAVTAAYHRPPQSTYEIMHPVAYLKRWQPVDVTLHGIQGFTTWTQLDDDVFGALGYDSLLRQFGSARIAATITDGYRGDRYVFLQDGTLSAMRLDSVWVSHAAARAAESAFVAAGKHRFPHGRWRVGGGVKIVRYRAQAIGFRVAGASLAIVYAPTPALAETMATAPTT